MAIPKERVRETLLWAFMGLSGVGAVGANVGGAALSKEISVIGERVAKTEAAQVLEVARLDRIESKIDRLLERK